jgi:hypothetical protein
LRPEGILPSMTRENERIAGETPAGRKGKPNGPLRGCPRHGGIAARPMIGSLDQFSNSTDLLDTPSLRVSLRRLYE